MPKYEVAPHQGVAPVLLGMNRKDAHACMPSVRQSFRKTSAGPWFDAWHESSFQAFYSMDDTVEYIELSRGGLVAILDGLSVLETPAAELIHQLEQRTAVDRSDPELGYSYIFPEFDMAFWRQSIPESASDPKGQLFDTIGVGVSGNYGGAR